MNELRRKKYHDPEPVLLEAESIPSDRKVVGALSKSIRGSWCSRHQLGERGLKRDAAQVETNDLAIGIDEVRRWNRANAERVDEVGACGAVVELRPGELAYLREVGHGRSRLVEADTEDLEPRAMVLVIGGLKSGQFADAWPAPGGPEINQDDIYP